ncbi:unnamed protein product [Clonostachys chloroleuca]|uniref:Uncharacterized protein n=1 Tax=Clonostachys chloroleuca TaxID=1926264 RepID=A0AA35LT90_9HYPO|nr:unnamed protein product [Clonostachys chloroleuca]
MAAYYNHELPPRLFILFAPQYETLGQELHMMHTSYNIYNNNTIATNTPPPVPPHASHGGHPTTIGPGLSNDPTITLDQATRELISIQLLGSTEWHGMCALNCQQTRNFISVEAMRQIGFTVEHGGQYQCAWKGDDSVERVGIFQAVSGLGADVAFGVNWLDNRPAPATAISIDTTPHSRSNTPSTELNTTSLLSRPNNQPSIDDHPARPESQNGCGNTRDQKQKHEDAPISMGLYEGHVLWPIFGCLALGSFYLWQKTRAAR